VIIGHAGVAYALRPSKPRATRILLLLTGAAFAPDAVQSVVGWIAGYDASIVWSHSIPAVFTAGFVSAVVCGLAGGRRVALLAAVATWTHWPLDAITGLKPLTLHGPFVGLGLYERPVVDTIVETALLLFGAWLSERRGYRADRRVIVGAVAAHALISYLGSR
jgi:hypothetical protein